MRLLRVGAGGLQELEAHETDAISAQDSTHVPEGHMPLGNTLVLCCIGRRVWEAPPVLDRGAESGRRQSCGEETSRGTIDDLREEVGRQVHGLSIPQGHKEDLSGSDRFSGGAAVAHLLERLSTGAAGSAADSCCAAESQHGSCAERSI